VIYCQHCGVVAKDEGSSGPVGRSDLQGISKEIEVCAHLRFLHPRGSSSTSHITRTLFHRIETRETSVEEMDK